MGKNKSRAQLVRELCPICTNEQKSELIGGPSDDPEIVNKWVEYCLECKQRVEKGYVLIGVDETKTTNNLSPWRTGNILTVEEPIARTIFLGKDPSRVSFVDISILKDLKLI